MYIYHDGKTIVGVSESLVSMDVEVLHVPGLGLSAEVLIRDYVVKGGHLVKKFLKVDAKDAKIAWVSVWKIQCGISTYSEFLVNEMRSQGYNVKVFAESYKGCTDDDNTQHCWSRGKPLTDLCAALEAYDPDFIYVQHEYGIFPDARHWTRFVSFLNRYNYTVALHSVYHHKDKTVCEAVCRNIIVHSEAAKEVLVSKGVGSQISVIPHGCITGKDLTRLWNIYRSPHTLMQFGFGFEYKGWNTALKAVALLKEKYPDIFYLILFSESNFSRDYHESQFHKIEKLIEELGISDNVAAIRGFQTEAVIDTFLRTIRVAVFPYSSHPDHIVYGSTGAARIAMANGTPVIVSKLPLFFDLEGIVPRTDGPEELAVELDKLFSDAHHYEEVRSRGLKLVEDTSWANSVQRYIDVLEKA